MDQPTQITDVRFASDMKQAGKPIMIGFVAEWCGTCHILEPLLHRLSKRYTQSVQICVLDIEQYPQTKARLNVLKLPTLLFFKDGELVEQFIGLISENALSEKLDHMVTTEHS